MRIVTLLVALAPCVALAAEDAPAAPPAAEAAAVGEAAPPAAPPVAVAPAPEALEPLPPPPPPPPATAPVPRWGVALAAGVPQAATLSLVFRPVPLVRLHAGPSWGYLRFGYHGGVTLTPFRWAVTPTLGVEAGRFSALDATKVVKASDASVAALMKDVDVTYAAALIGLELGSQRGFAFDLRLGLTWLKVASHGTGTFTGSGGTVGAGGTTNEATISVTDPTLRASAPALQLGLQYFF